MQNRLTEKQTEAYLYMQAIEDECKIDATKQIDYPPVAISFGQTIIKTLSGNKTFYYLNTFPIEASGILLRPSRTF